MATTKVTPNRTDCIWLCEFGNENDMLRAYNDNDLLELGRLVKGRIEECAAARAKTDEEMKAKYRAEILAEVCAGGEA